MRVTFKKQANIIELVVLACFSSNPVVMTIKIYIFSNPWRCSSSMMWVYSPVALVEF